MVENNSTEAERQSEPGSRRPLWLNILLALILALGFVAVIVVFIALVIFMRLIYAVSTHTGGL